MAGMGQERRLARMNADYTDANFLTDRGYNVALGLTVLYGIGMNIVLCALFGNVYQYINPLLFLVLYIVLAIAGSVIANRSDNPVISFLGYNMIVIPLGLMISTLISYYGGLDSAIVLQAFYYTALISLIMVLASALFPQAFARIGGFLFVSLIGIVIASFIGMFFTAGTYVISLFAAVIFSLYIGFDIYRAQQFPKTLDNAIDCAIDIYLDIANLFIRILDILGRRN